MAQAVAKAIKGEDILGKDGTSTDFQSAVARALDDLSATSENLQVSVQEVQSLFLPFFVM